VESTFRLAKYYKAASAIYRDAFFRCPVVEQASFMAKSSPEVWYYEFKEYLTLPWLASSTHMITDYGVFHGVDMILLFNGVPSITIGHRRAIRTVQNRIMSFVNGGSPGDGNPKDQPVRVTDCQIVDHICLKWRNWPISNNLIHGIESLTITRDADHNNSGVF